MNGPDPAVQEAIQRLTQTQLSPLEETLFQAWMKAHEMDNAEASGFDFRKLYQDSGGKVMPPSEMKNMVDIETIMKAQEAHDAASPIQQIMAMQEQMGGKMGGMMSGSGEMEPEMPEMMGPGSEEV